MAKVPHFGQCFLCTREVTMQPGTDSKGGTVYTCPRCGGMNSHARVEARKDIRGSLWEEYGPRTPT